MRIPIEISSQTLIGVNMYKPVFDGYGNWLRNVKDPDKFPLKRGNCFNLIDPEGKKHKIVNFCVENLEEWMERTGQTDIEVECIPKSDNIWMIKDDRIPKDWYSDHFCEVCTPYRLLPFEQRKEMFKRTKVSQYTDDCGNKRCIFTTQVGPKTEEERKAAQEKLEGWTCEFDQEIQAFHSVDAEAELSKSIENWKGENTLLEGAVYAPYIPMLEGFKVDLDKLPKKGILAKFAKKIINPKFYRKIDTTDERPPDNKEEK